MSAPLYNMPAEMAVLGAVLSDNGALVRIQDVLAPDDFHHPANQAIWETAGRLISEGRVADGVTLKEHFEKADKLLQIGGGKYLADLLASACFGPEISDYAAVIRELAGRRRITLAAEHILREAAAHDGLDGMTLDELASLAQTAIDQATRVGERRKFVSMPVAAIKAVTAALERRGGGLSTGLKTLDRRIGGLFPGDLYIVASRPSMGKTALAVRLANNVASQDVPEGEPGGMSAPEAFGGADAPRRRVAVFFSLEMTAGAVSQRALSAALFVHKGIRLPYASMKNGWVKPEHRQPLAEAAKFMPFVNVDDRPEISLGYLRERAGALVKAHGRLDLLIVDYLQLMQLDYRNKGETDTAAIGRITKGLKALAKEHQVPVVALSQLSRALENREDKRPLLADLRDSGSIEQDADTVLFVYREHYYLERAGEPKGKKESDKLEWQNNLDNAEPRFDIICAKQRQGPIGDAQQFWDGATGFIADEREAVSLP